MALVSLVYISIMTLRNPNLGLSQARARRRRLLWIRLYIVIFLLCVVIFGLAILSGYEKLRIKQVNVSGQAAVTTDEILNIVKKDTGGRYGYLFARNNFLIFPRFRIERDILRDIKTVKWVDVGWNKWLEIFVEVEERKPHSVWCGNEAGSSDTPCYFVDQDGYIYSQAPVFSGTMFIRNYSSLPGDNPIGQFFLTKDLYEQLFALMDILKEKGLKVVTLSFDGTDYHFKMEDGLEIIFNNKIDLATAFQNLFSALETGSLDLKKEASTIRYIDLRFDNRIVIGRK